MADEHPAPLVRLDPGVDGPPSLSYNVPDPTSYTGRNVIALDFGALDPFSPQVAVTRAGDAVLRFQHTHADAMDELGALRMGDLDLGAIQVLPGPVAAAVRRVLNSGVQEFIERDPS